MMQIRSGLRRSAVLVLILLLAGVATYGIAKGDGAGQVMEFGADYVSPTDPGTSTASSGIQARQSVHSDGSGTRVTQSTTGDGTVTRWIEQTEGGIRASQQARGMEPSGTVHKSHTYRVKKRTVDGANYTRKVRKTKDGTTIIIIIRPGDGVPPQNRTPDTPPADGNGTVPPPMNEIPEPPAVPDNDTTGEPPEPEEPVNPGLPGNDTGDGDGDTELPVNLTEPNGSDIVGNASGVTNLTPPEGAPLLGDRYQTPPGDTPEQPPDVDRLGIFERILLFLRGILAAILNWFARLGTL